MAGKAQRKFVPTGEEWRELLPAQEGGGLANAAGEAAGERGGPPGAGDTKGQQPDEQGRQPEQGTVPGSSLGDLPGANGLPRTGQGSVEVVGSQDAQGNAEPGFLQRLRGRFMEHAATMAKEFSPASIERKKAAFGVSLADSATFGLMDEGVGAIKAGVEAAKRAVGLGQQPTLSGQVSGKRPETIGEVYRRERDEVRGVTKAFEKAEPVAALAGTAASLAVGSPSAALTAPGKLRKVAAVGETLLAALGSSEAELTGERKEIASALTDVGIGAAFAPLALLGGSKTGRQAERAYARQVAQDVGEGATALQQRRAIPDEGAANMVIDLVEKRPELKRAIRGDKQELATKANDVVKELAVQTEPLYQQFDELAGQIPARDMLKHVQGEIHGLAMESGTKAMRDALGAVADDIVAVTKARAAERGDVGPQFGGAKNWTHREARDWVTQLLEREQHTMGSLNETERGQIVNALHNSADTFLRARLETAAAANPQLQQAWDTLRPLNRDIAAAIRIRDLAKAVDKREFQARGKGLERAVTAITATAVGAGGALAGGGDLGTPGAVAGGLAAAGGVYGAKGLSRAATVWLGKMARASRAGEPVAQLAEKAIEAGAPQRVVRALQVSLAQNRAKEKREKEEKGAR